MNWCGSLGSSRPDESVVLMGIAVAFRKSGAGCGSEVAEPFLLDGEQRRSPHGGPNTQAVAGFADFFEVECSLAPKAGKEHLELGEKSLESLLRIGGQQTVVENHLAFAGVKFQLVQKLGLVLEAPASCQLGIVGEPEPVACIVQTVVDYMLNACRQRDSCLSGTRKPFCSQLVICIKEPSGIHQAPRLSLSCDKSAAESRDSTTPAVRPANCVWPDRVRARSVDPNATASPVPERFWQQTSGPAPLER